MTKKQENVFISSHTRIIISDWEVLANLITKHGQLIKEQSQLIDEEEEESSLPHVISRREVEDAIKGPMQGFFTQKMAAYMTLSLVRMNLNIAEDDSLKGRRADLPDADKVPERILKNTSQSDLFQIQQTLAQLTTEHADVWEKLREEWVQQILQRLDEQGLSLSEIEIKEFKDPEPISELLDRFVALNIDLPKTRKSEMNYSSYLTLKANITIQSALSRQHLPHSPSDIQKVLSKLKSDFNAIAKQESALLSEQKTTTNEVVANISW